MSTHTLQKPEGLEAFQAPWLQVQGALKSCSPPARGKPTPRKLITITSPPFTGSLLLPPARVPPTHWGCPHTGDPLTLGTPTHWGPHRPLHRYLCHIKTPVRNFPFPWSLTQMSAWPSLGLCPASMRRDHPPGRGLCSPAPCPAETRPRWAHHVITGSPQTDGHSATTHAELETAASHSPQAQADPGGHWWVLGLLGTDMAGEHHQN